MEAAAEDVEFRCQVCNDVLRNLVALKTHYTRSHEDTVIESCEFCHNIFISKYLLHKHKARYHPPPPPPTPLSGEYFLYSMGRVETPQMRVVLRSIYEGLQTGQVPELSKDGCGGAYFCQDSSGKPIAVFKPADEEVLMKKNPRGYSVVVDVSTVKRGICPGEGAFREFAAYVLDHPANENDERGFCGVPATALVKFLHRNFNHAGDFNGQSSENVKFGSLQLYEENAGTCDEFGSADISDQDVQKLSIIDIRFANADRNAGNVLVRKNSEGRAAFLVPIDHGYCFPKSFEDCEFEWLWWAQAEKPYLPDTVAYINKLDASEDIKLIKSRGWTIPQVCANNFKISTALLKKGVQKGLTPRQIGRVMVRETVGQRSVIEEVVEEAKNTLSEERSGFPDLVSGLLDQKLDEVQRI